MIITVAGNAKIVHSIIIILELPTGAMEYGLKTKRIAIKHKRDIGACNKKPFDAVIVEIENEFGDFIKS